MENPVPLFRRCGLLAAGLALACAVAAVEPARSQPDKPNGTAAASATTNRNVYTSGGQVTPSSPVKGDFTAAGGKVVVDQPVAGDASVAGGSVSVRAPVGDDVRAVGGDVSIESSVGGELFAAGANITVTSSAAISRGAKLYGSNVAMDGRVDGDLAATGQKVKINGEVRGNARLVAEAIELGPNARINGALSYASRSELSKAEGATISGAVTRDQDGSAGSARRAPEGVRMWEGSVRGPSWAASVMSFLALLAFAAIFLLIVPRFGEEAADRIQASPWLSLAIGFGSFVAVPVLALLLFVTLLGIPLAIAVLALYPALLLAGFVVGVLLIARLLARGLRKPAPADYAKTMGYFAAGLLLTLLVAKVPLAGGVVVGLLSLAGVGACVLELYRRRNGPRNAPAAERPGMTVAAQRR